MDNIIRNTRKKSNQKHITNELGISKGHIQWPFQYVIVVPRMSQYHPCKVSSR